MNSTGSGSFSGVSGSGSNSNNGSPSLNSLGGMNIGNTTSNLRERNVTRISPVTNSSSSMPMGMAVDTRPGMSTSPNGLVMRTSSMVISPTGLGGMAGAPGGAHHASSHANSPNSPRTLVENAVVAMLSPRSEMQRERRDPREVFRSAFKRRAAAREARDKPWLQGAVKSQ